MNEEKTEEAVPSTTTAEQNRHTAGQRHTSLIWESTQMRIALSVIWMAAIVSAYLVIMGEVSDRAIAFLFLSNLASNIIGFYFGRTNHQRVGGVGGDSAGTR